jgi:hypothetical protein
MHLPRLKHLKLPLEYRSYFYPILDQSLTVVMRFAYHFAAILQERNRDAEPGVKGDKPTIKESRKNWTLPGNRASLFRPS